jgi:hypothetical protein
MNCYKSLCTEFYDTDKPTAPPDELAFYLEYVKRAGGPILEPMCGSGRFLVPILQAGFDIDGFDASPQMLAACRAKFDRLGLRADVSQQTFPDIELSRKYALAMTPAGSLGLITDLYALKQSLRRIRYAMLPGAVFVLDTNQRKPTESGSWPWGGRWVDRADGARLIISWLGRYDETTSIKSDVHRYDLIDKHGQLVATEFEDFKLRLTDASEMESLLREAGFTNIRRLKAHEQREPDEADEYMVIECVAGSA